MQELEGVANRNRTLCKDLKRETQHSKNKVDKTKLISLLFVELIYGCTLLFNREPSVFLQWFYWITNNRNMTSIIIRTTNTMNKNYGSNIY